PSIMCGEEEAVRMVYRVAGKTPYSEHGRFRPRVIADDADVGLPEAIDLHGRDHRVPLSTPERREHTVVIRQAFELDRFAAAWAWGHGLGGVPDFPVSHL